MTSPAFLLLRHALRMTHLRVEIATDGLLKEPQRETDELRVVEAGFGNRDAEVDGEGGAVEDREENADAGADAGADGAELEIAFDGPGVGEDDAAQEAAGDGVGKFEPAGEGEVAADAIFEATFARGDAAVIEAADGPEAAAVVALE